MNQRTTPDDATRVIRGAILDGRLATGSQLREARLASDLGISRAPLRDALTRLEEEGLVVKIPFRGAFVAEVSAAVVAEIATLRYLVEPYAAGLAAQRLRGPDRDRLLDAVDALRDAAAADDLPASIDAHLRFHELFYVCSGHDLLADLWRGWEAKLRLFLCVDHRLHDDLNGLATAHARLAALALDGDLEEFRRELAEHIHKAPGLPVGDGLKSS